VSTDSKATLDPADTDQGTIDQPVDKLRNNLGLKERTY
jgi:hypothetical protein